jgi:rRNA maturation endonuclease Nob1
MSETPTVVMLYYCTKHHRRTAQAQCCGAATKPLYFCPFCDSQFAYQLDTCPRCGQRVFWKKLQLNK